MPRNYLFAFVVTLSITIVPLSSFSHHGWSYYKENVEKMMEAMEDELIENPKYLHKILDSATIIDLRIIKDFSEKHLAMFDKLLFLMPLIILKGNNISFSPLFMYPLSIFFLVLILITSIPLIFSLTIILLISSVG